jgi:asparagine synthase (glutamine-hydrolysing)
MCGIVGIVAPEPLDEASLSSMRDALIHRGPDDSGIWISRDRSVGLSHRRLSVIDTSCAGRNPMAWDRGRLQITYNGEIYNYTDLRDELEASGYLFRSNTDTEVVLAAYDCWGVDCLQKFVGMFAFGLWDAGRNQLFLARDRLGQKPLYYSEYSGRLAFASELKALIADAKFPRAIDPDAMFMYLRYGYVPAPRTIFGHASKLAPAHYAIWKDGRLEVTRYWDPVTIAARPRSAVNEADAARQLEELLRDSVRRQMTSDVPLGAFLSGGIDSSLIVALMQEQSAKPVQTFTIRFENPEFNEADHARAVADYLGTDHFEETCSAAQMIETIGKLPEVFDEPFADASAIPTYLVSRVARHEVTVALSGDGGDELFFGYERYRNYATRWAQIAAPRVSHGALETLLDTEMQYYAHWHVSWQDPEIAVMLGHRGQRSTAHETARRDLQQFTALERPPLLDLLTYLPDQILTKVDRASMALSLEARAPFLDHRVVEFALTLPLEQKWRGGESKWLLRQLLHQRVPRDLVDRPKMGFSVPLAELFRGGLREQIENAFAGPLLEDLHICPDPARAAWQDFLAGNNDSVDRIWTLFALTYWAERWM